MEGPTEPSTTCSYRLMRAGLAEWLDIADNEARAHRELPL